MTAPTVHPAAEQTYRLLPDFMRAADDTTNYTAKRLIGAASVALEKPNELLTIADPDTSVTGTCEVVNAAAAPRSWLGWLGWLVGIDTSQIADPYVRDAVGNAARTQRRGSRGSIRDVVQRTLTGSKSCRVYWNLSGTDPYLITVVTITSQTANPVATLEAAHSEKPAGLDLELQVTDGFTYAEVQTNFDDYAEITNTVDNYTELLTYDPLTP